MLTFNLIGAGQVGKALSYLLAKHTALTLNCALSRTTRSARDACAFVEQGKAITEYADLTPADIYLITTPDQNLAESAEKLAATKILRPGNIVLHCSGVISSSILNPIKAS